MSEEREFHNAQEKSAVLTVLVVADVLWWYDHLKGKGVKLLSEIKEMDKIQARCFFVEVPGGYPLRLSNCSSRELCSDGPNAARHRRDLGLHELEVMHLIASGLRNRQIVDRLVTCQKRVRAHFGNMLSRWGLADHTQVAIYGTHRDLVTELSGHMGLQGSSPKTASLHRYCQGPAT